MKPSIKYFLFLSVLIFAIFSNKKVFAEEFWDIPAKQIVKSATGAKMVSDSTGKNVYIAYACISMNIKKSSDYGKSFSPSVELSSGVNLPNISTNDTGKYVYVIWAEDKNIFSSASSDYGVSFIDPIELFSCGVESLISEINIITNSTGEIVYAIWIDDYDEINLRVSTDFGTRFSDVIKIANGSNPHIITDPSGKNVLISFESDSIQVIASSDYGNSFSKPIQLDKAGENQMIAASNDTKNIYVVFEGENDNLQLSASSDFGANWYAPLTFLSDGSYSIDLVTNSSGRYVYFVWNDGNENIHMRASTDYGKGFSTINLNDTGTCPKIVTDSSGKYVFLIWVDSDYNTQFRASTDFGVSFDSAIKLTNNSQSMFTYPFITIDEKGKFIHILWNAQGGAINVIDGARLLSTNDS
ncbi:hypothetical protein LCGC14_2004660 [marine sediment metagenome]|uniref:Sialidase domain-containing protein n=1 Tax=marine sediment metagenome TaxID=412755 RepID=A0A0F9HZ66_9ZZZZ